MIIPQIFFNYLLSFALAASTSLQNPMIRDYSEVESCLVRRDKCIIFCAGVFFITFAPYLFCSKIYSYKPDIFGRLHRNDLNGMRRAVLWGADINQQDNDGCTPIHIAAMVNLWDILRFLLHENASLDILTKNDNSPLDSALQHKRFDFFLCLLLHNARTYNKKTMPQQGEALLNIFNHYYINYKHCAYELYDFMIAQNVQEISYIPKEYEITKKYDIIGFGLRNNDHKGIKYCREKKCFDIQDILMAIADDKRLTHFLSRYLEDVSLKTIDFRGACNYAKTQENKQFLNAHKNYGAYFKALQRSRLRNVGDVAITRKVLSYLNCEE